jgi:hypothetical protein
MTRLTAITLLFVCFTAAAVAFAADNQPLIETIDDTMDRSAYRPTLIISSKTGDSRWSKKRAIYPLEKQTVRLRIADRKYDKIRWYLIFADLTRNYKNANNPWEPNAYAWVGFEKIQYHRMLLTEFSNQVEITPFPSTGFDTVRRWFSNQGHPSYRLAFYNDGVGTFWFQVEAEKGKKRYRSRGIEDADSRGLTKDVMRVSIRQEGGYLGYLTSFYNIPGIFGSVLSQSINHIGADCADILMSARSKWRGAPLRKNYNVTMLVDKFPTLAAVEMSHGVPSVEVRWEKTIRPGDFIAVRYGDTGKKYHHIGALYRDANENGILDGADLVLHAGPDPLHLSPLDDGMFDGHVALLRN